MKGSIHAFYLCLPQDGRWDDLVLPQRPSRINKSCEDLGTLFAFRCSDVMDRVSDNAFCVA